VSTAIVRIVVTDSNVLINLIHVSRLDFTVEQADADKLTLEGLRFKMLFASFREVVK